MRRRTMTIGDKKNTVPSFMDFKGREKLLKSTNAADGSDKKRKSVYEPKEKHDLKLKTGKSSKEIPKDLIKEDDKNKDLHTINEGEIENLNNIIKDQKKLLEEKEQEIKIIRRKRTRNKENKGKI